MNIWLPKFNCGFHRNTVECSRQKTANVDQLIGRSDSVCTMGNMGKIKYFKQMLGVEFYYLRVFMNLWLTG